MTVTASSAKTAPTVYTYEMRENARINGNKYDWAKSEKKAAIEGAEEALIHLDELYGMIVHEGIPRAFMVGLKMDPNGYSCIYCKKDLREEFGSYPWGINPYARPWKIQCPNCKRTFPSNDFESFYKLGLNEQGVFDVEAARAKNAELVANGGKGYLVNLLYPEVGTEASGVVLGEKETVEGWAVDDGLGYVTGEIAANGKPETKTFIAYYNHFAPWIRMGGSQGRYVLDAVDNLRDAYLYTGDQKYGRAGAILIDRIADVYPGYDLKQWAKDYPNSDGGRNTGKILGAIWNNELTNSIVCGYDAFYPAIDDPYVIDYLSKKAEQYNLANPKTSAELIRENCETGILRETFDAAKTSRINGNFGMHQYAVALAAVALDNEAETGEMLDWIGAYSSVKKDGDGVSISNSGGNLLTQYVNEVDRDGFGTEIGASYNRSWYTNTQEIAELLYHYDFDTDINLYKNPKYVKMLDAIMSMTIGANATLTLGDYASTASAQQIMKPERQVLYFARTGDPRFAQLAYYLNGDKVDGLYVNRFEKNPENVQKEILEVIEKYGKFELRSENKAGFGLAVLRDGALYNPQSAALKRDTRRDVWMYYGRNNTSHAHYDKLSLGIDAYGFNFMPDLGYPAATGTDPNRYQWVKATISHNTVVVNEKDQRGTKNAKPLHFDDSKRVKLVDVDASDVYAETEIYRRTAVMVEASDDVAYTIDFFRVKGGNDHMYSFHSQSAESEVISGVELIPQVDENGEYIGTYADVECPFGKDPYTVDTDVSAPLKYPRGFTWLKNVRRDKTPKTGSFAINFKQSDFNKTAVDGKNLNMRFTALNDWVPSDITIATGETPLIAANKNIRELDYLLIKHSGNDLDTLYTTVLEPYRGERYLSDIQTVEVNVKSGVEEDDDVVKAVKVTHTSGRVDYVIYATNNEVIYTVADEGVSFDFRGFIGVYTINSDKENIYSYINDGDIIGEKTEVASSYTGKVVGFAKEMSSENSITVKFDSSVDIETLPGKYIYINNTGANNGVYKICGAEEGKNGIVLDVGDVTHITQYAVATNVQSGYAYNITEGQKFTIPVATTYDYAPVFESVSNNISSSAGSSITLKMTATSPLEREVVYRSSGMPRGATLDEKNGIIIWKPTSSQVGINHFAITAIDTDGRESTIHFDIEVLGSTTSGSGTGTSGGTGGGGGGTTTTPEAPNVPENPNEETEGGDANTRFVDLGAYPWAEDAINSLANDGIIKGTSENTFSPEKNITRADFAILLVRAFEKESDNTENFSDVLDTDYFAKELEIARNTGLVSGIGDNKFAPRESIKRCDMMLMVYRVLKDTEALCRACRPQHAGLPGFWFSSRLCKRSSIRPHRCRTRKR